jgi:hypothetical protein
MDLRERSVATAVEAYTSSACSSALLEAEFRAVQGSLGTQDNLSIRANRAAREVIAAYSMDESSLEMVIRLPAAYPLRAVEVRAEYEYCCRVETNGQDFRVEIAIKIVWIVFKD